MNDYQILTLEERMKNLLTLASNVAMSRASILLTGESGVGKELMARYIHNASPRRNKPFVAINCAALPEQLLESELFGYEKGAFTGADATKAGKIELAQNGTFLFDEIGELPMPLQSKLLRVLQESEVSRIGSTRNQKIDVRFLAATNRDLPEMIKNGEFRKDLYYRLNVIPLFIPPLRERPRDIALMAFTFCERMCTKNAIEQKKISRETIQKLTEWHWPGNVRELENVIERAILMTEGAVIEPHHVLIDQSERSDCENPTSQFLRAGMTIAQAEKALIMKTLEFTSNNKTKAADLLGISIRTLRNKLNDYKGTEVLA